MSQPLDSVVEKIGASNVVEVIINNAMVGTRS